MTENEAAERLRACQKNNGECENCEFQHCCGINEVEILAIKALEEKCGVAINEKQYEVYENTNRIASGMSLETALLLIRGYCERYCNERVRLTLVEMEGGV